MPHWKGNWLYLHLNLRVKIKMESNILEFERFKGPFIKGFTED